ncbi:DNA-binding protein, partial [Desulfovibrio sp. 1188_IL3213]|uniref:DNA-binding protein n=1 Tax=Desulfovibrio sp. 1188_IL3213 TaxID=3084052 RepID=UPI002FDB78C1
MAMATETYATRDIAGLLAITERAVQARAKRESWESARRSGLGGGNQWIISRMPPATRDAIASAMLREARVAAAS